MKAIWLFLLVTSTLIVFPVSVPAQPPTAPAGLSAADLDRLATEVLKEIHNLGADLYNTQKPTECLRMYESSLRTIRPFLGHRPEVQKLIDDGLKEVASLEGIKVKAYRLHEVIEEIRTTLRGPAGKKAEKTPPVPSTPGGLVTGRVTLDGQPLAGVELTVVTLTLAEPRVFHATTKPDGSYALPAPLPTAEYAVKISGGKQPQLSRYKEFMTSGLWLNVKPGTATFDFDLRSK